MIFFRYLRWKNFLSTGNTWTEIKLNKSRSTLIVGENGAGKSTILDALSFALYNKPFRKINKPQLINSMNQKGLECEVEFDIGRKKYKIVRGMKPTKFEIFENDRLLNQDADSRDYQEFLEKNILKLNHKSFSQIVVLGSATFMPFMQLPAMHRREVIEDLLDIQIFTTMNTLLKDKISENKDLLNQATYQVDMTKEKISLQEQYIDNVNRDKDKQIKQNEDKIQSYLTEIKLHQDSIITIAEEVKKLEASIEDKDKTSRKKKKIEQLEVKLKDKIDALKKEIEFYDHYDNCPTCKQEIDHEFKCTTVDSKNDTLNDTSEGLTQLMDEYKVINARLEKIQEVQTAVNGHLTSINTHNTNIHALNKNIQGITSEIEALKKDRDFDGEHHNTLKDLKELLLLLESQKEEHTIQRSVYDVAQLILKDSGIKTKIIRQYVPIMNKLINKYLAAMDFFVQFELDENFNEKIKSRFRDDFSYASFSEGEKMRIDLALLFTWRAVAKLRNSATTNLLIMDEVFDSSLDSNGTDEFLKILNDLTSDTNVFIISHKGDTLYDKFHSVVKFEKHKNFSRIAA